MQDSNPFAKFVPKDTVNPFDKFINKNNSGIPDWVKNAPSKTNNTTNQNESLAPQLTAALKSVYPDERQMIEGGIESTALKAIAPQVGSLDNREALDKQLQKQLMPTVTSTAQNLHDLPEFDAFRKKYGFDNTFGLDKLPQFYDKAKSLNDYEGIGDYENLVDSIKNKIGNKALYQGMNIPQRSITEPNPNEQKLAGIADAVEGLAKGEGGTSLINPITGIIGAIDRTIKQGTEANDAFTKGNVLQGFAESIKAASEIPFTVAMQFTPGGQIINEASGLATAVLPENISKWQAPVTAAINPQTSTGKALASLADMGVQFGVAHLVGKFSPFGKNKIISELDKNPIESTNPKEIIDSQIKVIENVINKSNVEPSGIANIPPEEVGIEKLTDLSPEDKVKAQAEVKSLKEVKNNLDDYMQRIVRQSGVDADYKGMNTNKENVTGITIDAVVDPNNPDPALRKTSITLKPEEFSPENIRKAVEEKQQHFKETQNAPTPEVGQAKQVMENIQESSLSGISQRMRESRSDQTKIPATETGIGWSGEEALNRGKDLLKQGTTAENVLSEFQKDGKISDDGMAVVRAKNNELTKASDNAGDTYGADSKEYQDALKQENNFRDAIKPMQTEWSKIGIAQQGAEDINTGSWTSLTRVFREQNKVEPTEVQSVKIKELATENKTLNDKITQLDTQAQEYLRKYSELLNKGEKAPSKSIKVSSKELADKIRKNAKIHRPGAFYSATPASLAWDLGVEVVAKSMEVGGQLAEAIQKGIQKIKETDWYKKLSALDKQNAENEFRLWHENQAKTKFNVADLQAQFADKKDYSFSPKQRTQVWQYAKDNYIDKGKSFKDTIYGLSKDLGLTAEQVRRIIAEPKRLREVTDESYKLQNQRRQAILKAKNYIETANTPQYLRIIKSIPNATFGWFTLGHGTVFGAVHAGMELFRPTRWNEYFKAEFRQWKFAYGNTVAYEKAMQDLMNDPNFIMWKRAKLAIDPTKLYDDYQLGDKYLGKIGMTGERGFNSWKIYRLNIANMLYDRLSEAEKADPQTVKNIADEVNHSTGTMSGTLPKWTSVAFFAPRLEASRWIRIFGEPAIMVKDYLEWGMGKLKGQDIPESTKYQAKLLFKKNAETLVTLGTLLAVNDAILMGTGSKQRINFTNPYQSDWMRFKAFDQVIDPTGGMLSATTFTARLLGAAIQSEKAVNKLTRGQGRAALIYQSIGEYLRGKFAPAAETGYSFAARHDYNGNTLPPFKDKPLFKDAKHLSWAEFVGTDFAPLPVSMGISDMLDIMKSKGMKENQINTILNGIFVSSFGIATGIRSHLDYNVKKK